MCSWHPLPCRGSWSSRDTEIQSLLKPSPSPWEKRKCASWEPPSSTPLESGMWNHGRPLLGDMLIVVSMRRPQAVAGPRDRAEVSIPKSSPVKQDGSPEIHELSWLVENRVWCPVHVQWGAARFLGGGAAVTSWGLSTQLYSASVNSPHGPQPGALLPEFLG